MTVTENNPGKEGWRRLVPFTGLLVADAVSEFGKVVSSIAIPWFVLQTTGSAARTGLVAGSIVLGFVIAGLLGGPLVDRAGFKFCSVAFDVSSGAAVAAIPLLYATVGLAFWQLVALTFLGALLSTPGKTARRGLVPLLADSSGVRAERATSAYLSAGRLAQILGPPIAGVLVAVLAPGNALWVNAGTFLLASAVVAVAVPHATGVRQGNEHRTDRGQSSGGYFADLAAGLRFVRKESLVFAVVSAYVTTEFLDAPLIPVILPVYADSVYGSASSLGLMVTALGAGALVGSLLYGVVASRFRGARFFGWFMLALQAPFWVLTTTPAFPLVVLSLFVTGVAAGMLNVLLNTAVQERTPNDMLGRVFGAVFSLGMAAVPLGMALAGYALEVLGLVTLLITLAGCYAVVSLFLLLNPRLRCLTSNGPEQQRKA